MLFAAAWLLAGCDGQSKVVWRQFNNVGDSIRIEVAPGEPGEAIASDLTSNTGAVTVGDIAVTPGRGPVGTTHLLLIEVADEWQDRIGRATVTSDGARGEEIYDLRQDAADAGIFDLTLTSLGTEGETRTDTWTITLWEPIDAPEAEFVEEGQ